MIRIIVFRHFLVLCSMFYYFIVFVFFFFFFFQAEDGIRDTSVTGVQTCALPISLVPGGGVGWRVARGPVACGPLRGDVFRALREFHDVPLRDADVFEHTPGGEGLPRGFGAPDLGRPVGDRVLEGDMGVTPIEQLDEMVAERALGIGATRFALDRHGGSVSLRRAGSARPGRA